MSPRSLMARVLGVDYGRVRCGLAISDPLGRTAQPLEVVDRPPKGSLVKVVVDAAVRTGAERIVVGLPLKMDGTPGVEAEAVKAFAAALHDRSGLPVQLWDERLSTIEAARGMREAGVTARKQRGVVDKVAAAVVLQAYLDSVLPARPHPEDAVLPEPAAPAVRSRNDAEDGIPRRASRGAKRRRQALRPSRREWLDADEP